MWCSICAGSFTTVSMLLKHIRLAHADRPDFNLQCNIQGCKRTFKRFTTFRNHIYQHHDVQAIAGGHENREDNGDTVTVTSPIDSDPVIDSYSGAGDSSSCKSKLKTIN